MNKPTCDYVPMWGTVENRCGNEALLRVLRTGSAKPDYKDRCLPHGGLGRHETVFVAYREPGATAWKATT
jgi:hypothetical protein